MRHTGEQAPRIEPRSAGGSTAQRAKNPFRVEKIVIAASALLLTACSSPRPGSLKNPPAAPAPFRDIAAEAGLEFQWGHKGKTPLNILETAGGGAGFIDFNRDNLPDIVLVGSRIGLFRNLGAGRFKDVSAGSGLNIIGDLMGCAVGDFDNDGYSDLFITGYGTVRLYRNRGGMGEFIDVTESSGMRLSGEYDWPTSAGFIDVDADGLLDLIVCRYVKFTPKSRQLCDYPSADGAGKVWAACPPLYYETQKLLAFRNRGQGKFEEMSSRFPAGHGNGLGLAFADYDDDGRTDIYVANDALPGDLYRNLGGWSFENVGTASGTAFNEDGKEQAGMGADWADFDGDGRLDLIVATFQNEPNSLYKNEGSGLFSYASNRAGIGDATRTRLAFGAGFIDFNADSFPDLLLANGHVQDTINLIHPPAAYAQTLQLFQNRGDGSFEDLTPSAGEVFRKPIVGRAAAVSDFDIDGRLDALVVDSEGSPLLLRNEVRSSNHWIGIRLRGLHGGRDVPGARVTLETPTKTLVAESQTCRGYLSSADPTVYFGLGSESAVRRLTVRWPSRRTTTLSNIRADQFIAVKEAESQ